MTKYKTIAWSCEGDCLTEIVVEYHPTLWQTICGRPGATRKWKLVDQEWWVVDPAADASAWQLVTCTKMVNELCNAILYANNCRLARAGT